MIKEHLPYLKRLVVFPPSDRTRTLDARIRHHKAVKHLQKFAPEVMPDLVIEAGDWQTVRGEVMGF